ncbi:MAG TPA: glycosyltransferase family 2 protein [Vitreimonas sp.]|uniref:glycosyltransferase family 2 protein n=1 Tax=Vitreimonas sp. TaxID=3069702 RepID=UPI002D23F09C|nr:glycosyltransferase family 2 protein [Vitreimonas sp.]HYD88942.1 glycosyltransferase family 2 protein [Vitreimonas sp.]
MNTTSRRLISVVVPTRDRPDYLRQALASIRALEGPEFEFEILVGDNGADPRSVEAARAFGAVHIAVATPGAGAARNAGLSAARGEFIAFLDDDDVWMDSHIRPHLALLDANPELDGVMAQVIAVDDEMRPLDEPWPVRAPREGHTLVQSMLSGYYPQIGATIVRARVRDEVGLFDERLLGDQDWDWQLRVARRRRLLYTPGPCVLFRQRPPGSYDALRLRRLGFGRRVFLRHALPEWRVFGSVKGLVRAYQNVMWQYYEYFVEAAAERAAEGRPRKEIWRAIWGAMRTFPFRAAYHLVAPKPLRKAFLASLAPRRHHPPPPVVSAN